MVRRALEDDDDEEDSAMRPSRCRPALAALALATALCGHALPATAEPVAETLVGTWTCTAKEGAQDVAMTLTYRRSDDFLVGEIKEDNGAALLDVWLDGSADGGPGGMRAPLSLRRIVSYDATIIMKVVEEAPTWVRLEGEMHHVLGTTARVREEFRFTGSEEFRALWEADSGDGWQLIMDRTCRRI
ncbi:hypothetical protein [Pelagibius sp. 7325]|uniref:hypothetical protein n=1 Tax=Pelagibius sp. 7325 TaxID=3131994 RepID=UPI0030EC59DF